MRNELEYWKSVRAQQSRETVIGFVTSRWCVIVPGGYRSVLRSIAFDKRRLSTRSGLAVCGKSRLLYLCRLGAPPESEHCLHQTRMVIREFQFR